MKKWPRNHTSGIKQSGKKMMSGGTHTTKWEGSKERVPPHGPDKQEEQPSLQETQANSPWKKGMQKCKRKKILKQWKYPRGDTTTFGKKEKNNR